MVDIGKEQQKMRARIVYICIVCLCQLMVRRCVLLSRIMQIYICIYMHMRMDIAEKEGKKKNSLTWQGTEREKEDRDR